MKFFYLVCAFACLSINAFAGDTTTVAYSNKKEVCINSSALIAQFIPFNLSETEIGLVGIKTKWYGKKLAFRTNLGLFTENNIFKQSFASIGYEKRKPLYKKFTYTTGWDFFVQLTSPDGREVNTASGPLKFYGLEYNFNERFFVGTEAQVMFGIGSATRVITQPPTNIFLCVRL